MNPFFETPAIREVIRMATRPLSLLHHCSRDVADAVYSNEAAAATLLPIQDDADIFPTNLLLQMEDVLLVHCDD